MAMNEDGRYDLSNDEDCRAACREYAQLQQNLLSSRSQDRMVELDGMAADAGKAFRMINRDAYSRMSALVTPKFVLEEVQAENDFADAIAGIPLGTPGMGMGPGQEM